MPIPSTGRACLALAQSVCWLLQAARRGRCCADRPFFCVALQCPARALVAGQHGSTAARQPIDGSTAVEERRRDVGRGTPVLQVRPGADAATGVTWSAASCGWLQRHRPRSWPCAKRNHRTACDAAALLHLPVRVCVCVCASQHRCVCSPAFASCCHRINADALMRPIPLRSCSNAADSRHSRDVRDASKKQLATAKHRTA